MEDGVLDGKAVIAIYRNPNLYIISYNDIADLNTFCGANKNPIYSNI